MTMNCHQAGKLISRLVDGRLDAGTSDRLKEHLRVCPSCAQLLSDYQKMKEMMAGLQIKEVEPLPYFEERVKARIQTGARPLFWAAVERWYAAAVPVFLIVAVILVGVLFLAQPEEVQMSQSEMALFQVQGPRTETRAIFEEEKPENRQLLILFAGLESQKITGRSKQ
jgi:anti-sigma factor RsiW